MATEDSSNTTPLPQMRPEDMRGLADRLRARAGSVLLPNQSEQHRDLLTAATLIEQFANVAADVLSSGAVIDLSRLLKIAGGV